MKKKTFSSFSDLAKEVLDSGERAPTNNPPETINNEYYYGEMKLLSNDNDVSFLHRGGVYYLKDYKTSGSTKTYHPYVIIQYKYYDKCNDIAAFGITSTPSSIDMIPIIVDNAITYIDPHNIYTFKFDSLKRGYDVRYIGDIVNSKAFNLALDFQGLFLGMNITKTEEEIYTEYFQYVDDFFERNQKFKPMKHRTDKDEERKLTIKFTTSRDVKKSINNEVNTEIPVIMETPIVIEKEEPKQEIKEEFIIDLKSQAVLSAIAEMEAQPKGSVILPSTIAKMTADEIVIFITYKKLNTIAKTSKFYNCSHGTVFNRFKQLQQKFDIIYR